MKNKNRFYVYAHYRKSGYKSDEIFYVGKGSGTRSCSRSLRTPHWHSIVNKYDYYVEILYDNLDEQTAFSLEVSTIARHGRKDLKLGPLVNLTDGGEGSSGSIRTQEQNLLKSISMTGKTYTKERCKNIAKSLAGKKQTNDHIRNATKAREGSVAGAKNPNYGKLGKDNHLSKLIQAIRLDTNSIIAEFSGLNEANRVTGLDFSNISKCCKGKISFSGLYNPNTEEWIKFPKNKKIPKDFVKVSWKFIKKDLTS